MNPDPEQFQPRQNPGKEQPKRLPVDQNAKATQLGKNQIPGQQTRKKTAGSQHLQLFHLMYLVRWWSPILSYPFHHGIRNGPIDNQLIQDKGRLQSISLGYRKEV